MSLAEVLCVGEVLWDGLPEGLFLGGAPFNVACHLRATGSPVAMVSRIGTDRLGEEVLRRATRYGVGIDLIQSDESLPTGFVRVTVDVDGNPDYEILQPSAWDAIVLTEELLLRAHHATAIVFGTLAQRNEVSRKTIQRLLDGPALKVLDVNLRAPFDDREIVRQSLAKADVVKLAVAELECIAEWFGIRGAFRARIEALAAMFDCKVVCVTRGKDGAALLRNGVFTEHAGFTVEVRDTVGAGDAFLAVLLAGLLAKTDDAAILQHANLMGAYVATQFGAVPADQRTAVVQPPLSPGRVPREQGTK